MYTTAVNAENRRPVLLQMMANHPLAALITLGESGLNASHIPMVHEEDGSEFGVLKGHVSRANGQWKEVSDRVDALAIFSGPEHYISPGWYPGKQEDGHVVPTWNYVVVHASGPLRIVRDEAWLMSHLESLTQQQEASFSPPWKVSDAPTDYIAGMLKAIVGFELPIRKLEGKWKLSQNRNERDRAGVIGGLGQLGTSSAEVMKALVEKV
ncbi:MAG: FMN-binding negative transcriptional regulator [Vicinamibacteria bacterium]